MPRLLLTVLIVMSLSGCTGLVPVTRERSQSVQATEKIAVSNQETTRRTLSIVPEMAIAVDSNRNAVVAIPLGSQIHEVLTTSSRVDNTAGSDDLAIGNMSVSIPLFVKLIGAAIGIALLVMAIRYAVKASRGTAVGAALEVADRGASSVIDAIEQVMSRETKPDVLAALTTIKAKAEKERGKTAVQGAEVVA